MNENETFRIHIQIGGFRIPLKIARKDEEIYRKAEKLVGEILINYQKKYSQRSNEEILTFVALGLAVALSKQELDQDLAPIAEKIKSLDEELKQLLAE